MNLLKRQLKKPTCFEEQKTLDSESYLIGALGFFITSVCILILNAKLLSPVIFNATKPLPIINLLLVGGFLIASAFSLLISFKAKKKKTYSELKWLKKMFIWNFIFWVGVPYAILTVWVYMEKDIWGGHLMIACFTFALWSLYKDWKNILMVEKDFSLN